MYLTYMCPFSANVWSANFNGMKASENKLRGAKRDMERIMLGITLIGREENEWIRQRIKVVKLIGRIAPLKWSWTGHITRRTGGEKLSPENTLLLNQ